MRLPDWLQPPRQLMLVFLAVAIASTALLAWLTVQLLAQDRAADQQHRRERLEQAADNAVLEMERRLSALERHLDPSTSTAETPQAGTVVVSWNAGQVIVNPPGGLPYLPGTAPPPSARSVALEAVEGLELADRDLRAAARAYAALTVSTSDQALHAAAWTGLARVHRKLSDRRAAIEAYARLETYRDVLVDGLPAVLIARTGRASIFEAADDAESLRAEARGLAGDLHSGALPLTRSQYTYYSAEAARWLGVPLVPDADAVARADGAEWLWTRRATLAPRGRQLLSLPAGVVLVSWATVPDGANGSALVVGPRGLAGLASSPVPPNVRWAMTDPEGRLIVGEAPPPRLTVTRTSTATDLPWTLHVFETPGTTAPAASTRRTLLLFVIASVAALLVVGWYFIWRGISRELRLARLQSDFVAAVSHEFRSPLTSLRHIGDLLAADRFGSEEQKRRSYAVLTGETERLGRLVEGLLDFARFEAGGATLHLAPTSVTDLVRSVVAECRSRLDAGNRTIALSPSLPELVVNADRDGLARALWNLLDNALKYSPPGGTIRVTVTEAREPHTAAVSVSDEGMGIPADEQHAIFDRFVRGSEAKSHRIQGTGVGLALVREIMRAHRGGVAVRSEHGVGSTFTLTLPLAGDAGAQPAREGMGEDALVVGAPGGGRPV